MLHRRSFLRGLFATPAIVAASSLMPIRGVLLLPDRFVATHYTVEGLDAYARFITERLPLYGPTQHLLTKVTGIAFDHDIPAIRNTQNNTQSSLIVHPTDVGLQSPSSYND